MQVSLNILALFCRKSYPGLVADLTATTNHSEMQVDCIRLSAAFFGLLDHEVHAQRYPNSLALLSNKGYV